MDGLTPQQIKFLEHYLDVKSDTFGNALQSALLAGYSREYAESITTKDLKWLSEYGGDAKRLLKAERNLEQLLDQDEDLKVKADITKFVAGTLGKKKYSSRQELTGKDGKDLIPKPIMDLDAIQQDNSDNKNSETEQENSGNTGRDISE